MPRHEAAEWKRQLITASISFWVRLEICTWDLLSSRHTTPIKGNFTKIRTKLHRAENMFPPEVSDVPPNRSTGTEYVHCRTWAVSVAPPEKRGRGRGMKRGNRKALWLGLTQNPISECIEICVAQQSVKQTYCSENLVRAGQG